MAHKHHRSPLFEIASTGERSSLLTHIAATVSASLLRADEKLTAFVELESAIWSCASGVRVNRTN